MDPRPKTRMAAWPEIAERMTLASATILLKLSSPGLEIGMDLTLGYAKLREMTGDGRAKPVQNLTPQFDGNSFRMLQGEQKTGEFAMSGDKDGLLLLKQLWNLVPEFPHPRDFHGVFFLASVTASTRPHSIPGAKLCQSLCTHREAGVPPGMRFSYLRPSTG